MWTDTLAVLHTWICRIVNTQRKIQTMCITLRHLQRYTHSNTNATLWFTYEYLRCVLRLLLTWPWPVQPGVGHFSTFSCMARTEEKITQSEKIQFFGHPPTPPQSLDYGNITKWWIFQLLSIFEQRAANEWLLLHPVDWMKQTQAAAL